MPSGLPSLTEYTGVCSKRVTIAARSSPPVAPPPASTPPAPPPLEQQTDRHAHNNVEYRNNVLGCELEAGANGCRNVVGNDTERFVAKVNSCVQCNGVLRFGTIERARFDDTMVRNKTPQPWRITQYQCILLRLTVPRPHRCAMGFIIAINNPPIKFLYEVGCLSLSIYLSLFLSHPPP